MNHVGPWKYLSKFPSPEGAECEPWVKPTENVSPQFPSCALKGCHKFYNLILGYNNRAS